MIYGELGVTPLYIDVQTRIISFRTKLDNPNENKLSSTVYSIIYDKHTSNKKVSPWITFVKILLCSLGFPEIWSSQRFVNAKWLVKAVNRKLTDMFIQNWTSKINIESKSNIYRIFKTTFEQSTFLNLLPGNLSKILFKFRTRNHRFPVETGS